MYACKRLNTSNLLFRALAMYEVGNKREAIRIMKNILRKQPGYADLHIAIAADAWEQRNGQLAEQVIVCCYVHGLYVSNSFSYIANKRKIIFFQVQIYKCLYCYLIIC